MQHQGGSQYVVPPDMTPFSAAATTGNRPLVMEHLQPPPPPVAEKASPISSRPPPSGFEDPIVGNYAAEDDALASAAAAGEEMERGGVSGNRWPRQETLALLKIRSDMDSAFRDATLKGPLWEDVSRKLGDLGYTRSAKKCKEKFENVHKYYKRTKEGRAGRQDGKNYRFFSQLEALNSATATASTSVSAALPNGLLPPPPPVLPHPMPISSAPPPPDPMPGISFSSNSSSSSESETDDDETEAALGGGGGRKRKARSSKMMELVEGMMRRVMERQEEMQKRFLETMEMREQERVVREEAWKRQEIAQLNREHDLLTQERSLSASRNSAIVSFLQKINGGQSVTLEQPPPPPQPQPQPPKRPPPAEVVPIQETPPPQMAIITTTSTAAATTTAAVVAGTTTTTTNIGGIGFDLASSRWPKAEVHALIKLRSGMETRYQEAGPKGPLWEEISAGMRRMGYNRSSKRCKEKWENINKYFKKVKESNKKRPEDAKTCPYFHQLDALYRKKNQEPASSDVLAIMPPPPPPPPLPPSMQTQTQITALENKNENDNIERNGGNGEGGQTSNGGSTPMCERPSLKKPEDIMKELIEHHQNQQNQAGMDAYETDNIDGEDDEEEEDEENGKMAYKIQFQRPPSAAPSNGGGNVAVTKTTTPGSFLAMVQ